MHTTLKNAELLKHSKLEQLVIKVFSTVDALCNHEVKIVNF